MSDERMIKVWRFEDAPQELRALSTNGGDEDWLAVVPAALDKKYYITWLECGHFGLSGVNQFTLPNGDVVWIGSHA